MRYIGIRHRVKKTAAGEARPTQVVIMTDRNSVSATYALETETDELDFLLGRFPVGWRKPEPDEDLSRFMAHHVDWRRLKKDEEFTQPDSLRKTEGKDRLEVKRVPAAYDGLKTGDIVASVLGGSGDRFCFALSRRGEEIDAKVFRLPGYLLNLARGKAAKDDDAKLLACLAQERLQDFYQVTRRDRDMITINETLSDRVAAMKARIGAEQRLRQRGIGAIFCDEQGKYPEGNLEDIFEAARASDKIVISLVGEEKEVVKRLERAVKASQYWADILLDVEGMGPLIAAPILAATVDIRRFGTKEGYKAFCGVHCRLDGSFVRARRERGIKAPSETAADTDGDSLSEVGDEASVEEVAAQEVAESSATGREPKWNRVARQALYLFVADQCNRRPDSVWGQKLREYKAKLREKHPEVVITEAGKKRYTDGHIHKMAIWRTATKFCEWFWKQAWALENRLSGKVADPQPNALVPPDQPPVSLESVVLEDQAIAAT